MMIERVRTQIGQKIVLVFLCHKRTAYFVSCTNLAQKSSPYQ